MTIFTKSLIMVLTSGLVMTGALTACSPAEPRRETNVTASEKTKTFDPELLALLPKSVPGHELGWLSGRWVKSDQGCGGPSYMHTSTSRDGLHIMTASEPGKADSGAPVQGRASVNPGERGFIYVTPPDWDNAYLRMKEKDGGEIEVEFVEFTPEETRWNVTDTFSLMRCG